jgi:Na+/H+-dicarboxylate symporter
VTSKLNHQTQLASLARSTDRLATRILWGLAIGLAAGIAVRLASGIWPALEPAAIWLAIHLLDPFGQIFLRLLFFVVVPLVFASLALGVFQLGHLEKLGPLAGRTFALFGLNMAIGVGLGLLMMNLLEPGGRLDPGSQARLLAEFGGQAQELQAAAEARSGFHLMQVVEMFMPRNILKAVVEFQILPLILFALLIGAAGTQIQERHQPALQALLEMMVELMTRIVHMALLLAPFAVPALIFGVAVKYGLEFLQSLALSVLGILAIMLVHLFGTMSLLLRLLTRRSPAGFFRQIRTVLVTAFSTSSSSATLPTSLQVARENLGVTRATAGFVLPLGATMNMSGTALYEGCVVLFIAQVYGVNLGLDQQLVLLLLAVVSAVAVAGIPGGSLPVIVGLLATFGIPAEGIALVLGADRLLDMSRTVLNVTADLVTACIVDEGIAVPTEAAAR